MGKCRYYIICSTIASSIKKIVVYCTIEYSVIVCNAQELTYNNSYKATGDAVARERSSLSIISCRVVCYRKPRHVHYYFFSCSYRRSAKRNHCNWAVYPQSNGPRGFIGKGQKEVESWDPSICQTRTNIPHCITNIIFSAYYDTRGDVILTHRYLTCTMYRSLGWDGTKGSLGDGAFQAFAVK